MIKRIIWAAIIAVLFYLFAIPLLGARVMEIMFTPFGFLLAVGTFYMEITFFGQ